MKTTNKIILILIACSISFFVGRLTTKSRETVRFVKGETITRTVEVPKYITSIIPIKPVLPVKRDTVYINKEKSVIQDVDTGQIIQNYVSERKYAFNVFDDKNGKLDINQTIQYNELQKFDYAFTPVQKVITQQKGHVIVPFASASYNTFGIAGVGGGVFYRNVGVEYKYQYNLDSKTNGHEFGIKIKF